jgi:serine protease Do/serine protease DegQ
MLNRFSLRTAAVAAGLCLALAGGNAAAALPQTDSQGQPIPSLAPMLDKTVPSVVNIFTRTRVPQQQHPLLSDPIFRHFFDMPQQPRERYSQSLGSGVIVDADEGYILTNNHVIDRAVEISVHLSDGRTLKAELVGTDPEADVAVIKVEAENLTALPLADSNDLRVGDFVVAIGNPFGLGSSATSGMVSALGRSGLGIEGYEDFIQTDASINPGNSGGALVDLRGRLVGINTAILSKSGGNMGIGFAIPINMAREIMAQLVEYGEVRRGQLGAQAQDLTPELAAAFNIENRRGAVVTQVTPDSPAHKAGLQAGDVITSINGHAVGDSSDVHNAIGLLRVGEEVTMTVQRNGDEETLTAVVEEPEVAKLAGEKVHNRLAGAVLGNIVKGMPMYGKSNGVLLIDVMPASPAWAAGLRRGDIIASANRKPVGSVNELAKAARGSDRLLLNIQRRGGALFLLLQ